MLFRRRKKLLKMMGLCLIVAIVPYMFLSNLETDNMADSKGIYFVSTRYDGTQFAETSNSSSPTVRTRVTAKYNDDDERWTMHKEDNSMVYRVQILKPDELPLTVQYCNNPFTPLTGEEGKTSKRFKLRMVHVFLRHGDRTPMHAIQGHQIEAFNCNFSQWYKGNNGKANTFATSMMQQAGKQPRRSHFLNWALLPNREKCQSSDLTCVGALQQLNNGQFLFQRYMQKLKLFDKKLHLMSQIYVRSTATPRTYQSAMAFMYGFLPSFNISQLHIEHAANRYMCSTLSRSVLSCNCEYLTLLEQKARRYRSSIHANSSEYASIKDSVAEILNIREGATRTLWLSAILDAIVPNVCHNGSMSCAKTSRNKCMDGKLLQRMWNEYERNQQSAIDDPNENLLKYLSLQLYPVALEMVLRMKELTEGMLPPRLFLYSGHDYTITAFLHVFGIPDNAWPPYASRLIFELFESDNRKGYANSKFYFRLLYNGKDLTKDVIFCKGSTFKGLCKFKLLADFVIGRMIRRFGYTSYSDACSRRT